MNLSSKSVHLTWTFINYVCGFAIIGIWLKEDYEIAEKDRDSAEKRKQNIEKKLSRLKDLYLDGLIEMDEYRADRERLEAELSDITDTPKKDFAEIRDLLDHTIGEIYETFSPEEKRFFMIFRSEIRPVAELPPSVAEL